MRPDRDVCGLVIERRPCKIGPRLPVGRMLTTASGPKYLARYHACHTGVDPAGVSLFWFLNERVDMKRLIVALLTLLLLTAPNAWAQKRVKFPPGRTTVILKGKTTGGPSESGGMNPISYVLRARKGQQMTLHLTSAKNNAVFGLYAPGMDLVEGAQSVSDWTGTLPKTGDYEIIVFPQDEVTNTTFTLEVTVR